MASDNNFTISDSDTDKIHDRIWIKNGKWAIAVGSSLNNIGSKLSFILELPEKDLKALLKFLKEEKLIPDNYE